MTITIGCNYCGEKLPDGEGHACVPVAAAVTGREELAEVVFGALVPSNACPWREQPQFAKNAYLGLADAILASDWLTAHDAEVKAAALETARHRESLLMKEASEAHEWEDEFYDLIPQSWKLGDSKAKALLRIAEHLIRREVDLKAAAEYRRTATPEAPKAKVEWEWATTTGPLKRWDNPDNPPEGEGWELDPTRGRPGESWDRFYYHEERYWRRRRTATPEGAQS